MKSQGSASHLMKRYNALINTYYWNGQLVWTPAVGLYLCVYPGVDPLHVELRNYVISRQIVIEHRVT